MLKFPFQKVQEQIKRQQKKILARNLQQKYTFHNATQTELEQLAYNLDISMPYPVVRCVECGRHIPHNHNLIQRHYLEKHNIDDSPNKKARGWKFNPTRLS